MIPRVWINSATFSDGTTLEFEKSDVVVFVGPNNAGKSVTLRNLREKIEGSQHEQVVVKSIELKREGPLEVLST